jgi:two-component system, NtrC family, sensor histidine kinase PilS
MAIDLNANVATQMAATRWGGLKLYNAYRLVIALMFLITQMMTHQSDLLEAAKTQLFPALVICYFVFSVIAGIFTWLQKPEIHLNLPIQIIIDIVFIVLMMHAQDGNQSGIGLLLIITITSASLISEGRYALFYAAVASIGILLEQTYRLLDIEKTVDNYTGAVMLSLSCFATAWLAHSLAKRMQQSELLASQRGLDVKNLAQVNALITHEMQDGVLVVDQHFLVKHHNVQAEAMLGLDSADWQQKPLTIISPEITHLMHQWIEEKEHLIDFGAPNIIKLSTISRELRLRFLPVSENRRDGAVIFIEDWSQMQTQAHQVKLAALGRLTANIAHEIRNPLSAISHANQLLLEEENIQPAVARMLQIIGDNVQRVDQIIKDVLELNRRDRTNQEIIYLENFIQEFYTQFCAVEKIAQDCFVLNLENADTLVSFDRRHLNQILWNLCKNGWRHSKNVQNSLQLTVSLADKTQSVHVEISDDGDGIPENIRAHLFEPFFTTEKTGTGLGLYIARELADANGAKLQFKTGNTGTQFIIHLKKA